MDDQAAIWQGVPETQPEFNFIVDEPKGNELTVVTDKEVAGYDVIELIYMLDGVWRITIQDLEDEDSDDENPGVVLNVILDRRYKPENVQRAVRKLLENLYLLDQ
jgi:hypothetical protein